MVNIEIRLPITDYRVMTTELKSKAVEGDVEAQKAWMLEELSEFYEAYSLYISGEANIYDLGEETLGCFRTAQSFPSTKSMLMEHVVELKSVLSTLDRVSQYAYYKAKKDSKGQALDMTYENLFGFIDSL